MKGDGKMQLRKLSVVLLALLLAGAVIVPCVSAAENVNADELSSDPYYLEAIKIISKENALSSDQFIPLNADLDLVVYNPSGNFVTSSNSWDNNYEIVEFTAATTGNYNIRLNKSRFAGTSERVGFAYTIYT